MSATVLTPSDPARLLILGSCVSRDILASATGGQFVLADYFARSSIASIGTDPFVLDEAYLARIESAFQRRMVQRDLTKEFVSAIKTRLDFDYILIDLIDERFDLFEAAPQAVITVSSELSLTRFIRPEDRSGARWIRSGSDAHRTLWKSGLSRLFDVLKQRNIADRVIVNKVFWTTLMEDGTALPQQDLQQREAANALLAWMYGELERYVPASRWLTYPEALLRSDPQHRWGVSPFHYSRAYYTEATAQMNRLFDSRRTDGGVVLQNGTILAWSGISHKTACVACFIVVKDEVVLYQQPYSNAREMHFDPQGIAGNYQVVILTLAFDANARQQDPMHRRRTVLEFAVGNKSSNNK